MNILKKMWQSMLILIKDERGDIGQMFTPPKSKSPWAAMTQGSSGGWAKPMEAWGPAFTTAAGFIPGIGPLISAGMGAAGMAGVGGFQGTDYGMSNIGSTLLGAGMGYGLGHLGKGIGSGVQNMFSAGNAGNQAGYQATLAGMNGGAGMFAGTGTAAGSAAASSGGMGAAGLFGQGFMNSPIGKFAGRTASGVGNMFGGAGSGGGAGTAGASGLFGGGSNNLLGAATMLGGAAGMFGAEQPEYEYSNAQERYDDAMSTVVGKYMGEGGMALPKRAQEEYLDMINTPFGELYQKWDQDDAMSGQLKTTLDRTYDDYDEQINAAFAQSGGIGSSDHRKALDESRRLRGEELRVGTQQLQQFKFQEAVKVKQDALVHAMQQGQWNNDVAMQLAGLTGQDQQLEMALASQDYDGFQDVMGKIMFQGMNMMAPNISMGG